MPHEEKIAEINRLFTTWATVSDCTETARLTIEGDTVLVCYGDPTPHDDGVRFEGSLDDAIVELGFDIEELS